MNESIAWKNTVVNQFFKDYNWTGILKSEDIRNPTSRGCHWHRQTVHNFLSQMYQIDHQMATAYNKSAHSPNKILSVKEYFDSYPW